MNKVKMVIMVFIINFIVLSGNSLILIAGDAPVGVPDFDVSKSQNVSADTNEEIAEKKKAADNEMQVAQKKDQAAKKEKEAAEKKSIADKKVIVEKKEAAASVDKAMVEKKTMMEPMPPKKEVAPVEKKSLPMISDIDTVDIEEGGNWLLKRKALEDTVDVIEQINGIFSKLLEASTNFKIQRNKIDNEFDVFLSTIGFDLGDADQLLTNLLDDLEEERKELGDLTADERSAIALINEKKNEIKQLQADLKALISLDDGIDEVLMTVDNQIKTANNYQGESWKNFQAIKKVLNDEKAEDLYYRTEGLFKSMQDIYDYLIGPLTNYFNGEIQTMRNQMNKIKNTIQSLQQAGVDLQQKVDKFEKEDVEREGKIQLEEQEKALEKAKKQKTGWMQSIMSAITYPFKQVKLLWNYLYSLITGWFVVGTKKTEIVEQQQSQSFQVAPEPVAAEEQK